MTMLLEKPPVKFIIPADEDLYVDNTPLSEDDYRRIDEYVKKRKANMRRRQRYAARKVQKNAFPEMTKFSKTPVSLTEKPSNPRLKP